MALADGLREQPLAPLRVMAVRAREVHLSAPQMVGGATRLEMRARRAGYARSDRHVQRLAREVSGKREQLLRLVTQRLRPHAIAAAKIDTAFEVQQLPARLVDLRVTRRDAAHALILVAPRAGEVFFPC